MFRVALKAFRLESQHGSRPIQRAGQGVIAENTTADRMHQNQRQSGPGGAEINQWRATLRDHRLFEAARPAAQSLSP